MQFSSFERGRKFCGSGSLSPVFPKRFSMQFLYNPIDSLGRIGKQQKAVKKDIAGVRLPNYMKQKTA